MKLRHFAAAAAGITLMGAGAPALAGDAKGVWLTESKKAHVEIYDCAGKLCGKIVWLEEPNGADGKPKVDSKNEDAALQTRPLMGMDMISDLAPDGDNEWADGRIYSAEEGKTYKSKMALQEDGSLKVKGCIAFLCKTQVWTRVK